MTVQNVWTTSTSWSWLDFLLSRIRYKAGWTFTASSSWPSAAAGSTGPCLSITMTVVDSVAGGDLRLTHTFQIPPHLLSGLFDEEACLGWIWECVIAVERHEAREFFCIDGRRWRDPHRENNTRLYE